MPIRRLGQTYLPGTQRNLPCFVVDGAAAVTGTPPRAFTEQALRADADPVTQTGRAPSTVTTLRATTATSS
ncbi:hypothetical protein SUDANB95_07909 (plasmid) [Actinosynnema sp. ALI-1.44]